MNTYQLAAIAMRIKELDRELKQIEQTIEQHADMLDVADKKRDTMRQEIRMLREGMDQLDA